MDIDCEQCGAKVEHVTKRRRFCCQKCADQHRYIPKPKTGKWLKCGYCDKDVWTPRWQLKFKARFCCRNHAVLFKKESAHRQACSICGKVFFCQPCQVTYRNRQTCSRKCRAKLISIRATIKRQSGHLTKHQMDRAARYSKEASEWRNAVFTRDNYTCHECGQQGGCLQAHHVEPFAYFPELRYEISNGQTLCCKCHDKTKSSAKSMKEKYGKSQTKSVEVV